MKYSLAVFLLFCITPAYPAAMFNEKYYQEKWCNMVHGQMEVVLPDRTRVDCLTTNYAVEVDFAKKWAEGLGQALHYAKMTDKKPAVVLIIEKPSDFVYYYKLEHLAKDYNVKLWYIKHPFYGVYDTQNLYKWRDYLLFSFI